MRRHLSTYEVALMLTRIFFGRESPEMAAGIARLASLGQWGEEENGRDKIRRHARNEAGVEAAEAALRDAGVGQKRSTARRTRGQDAASQDQEEAP
jgi:hypothetical protein